MKLLPCPFCGETPAGIKFKTHPQGRPAGYVLKIQHKDQCFIEHLSYAYYGEEADVIKDWNRRTLLYCVEQEETPLCDKELRLRAFLDGFGEVETVQLDFAQSLEAKLLKEKKLNSLLHEALSSLNQWVVNEVNHFSAAEPDEDILTLVKTALEQNWGKDVYIQKIEKQLSEAKVIIEQQKKTFLAALNNATKISEIQLRDAERLKKESSPEALDSERRANAILTEELEQKDKKISAVLNILLEVESNSGGSSDENHSSIIKAIKKIQE
jgi:hypothetical protein